MVCSIYLTDLSFTSKQPVHQVYPATTHWIKTSLETFQTASSGLRATQFSSSALSEPNTIGLTTYLGSPSSILALQHIQDLNITIQPTTCSSANTDISLQAIALPTGAGFAAQQSSHQSGAPHLIRWQEILSLWCIATTERILLGYRTTSQAMGLRHTLH